MNKQNIVSHKLCVECDKMYGLIHGVNSQEYRKRMFCGKPCQIRFNRRKNHSKPHPPEVLERLQKCDALYDTRDPITHRRG